MQIIQNNFFFDKKAIPLNGVKKLSGCLTSYRMENGKGDAGILNFTEDQQCNQ